MQEKDVLEWIKRTNCSAETAQMVLKIFNAGPTRQVQSRAGNVITMTPGLLDINQTILTESRTVEHAYEMILENDRKNVVGIIEQPLSMDIRYPAPDGTTVHSNYTPDFFVFWYMSGGWVETKTETELEKLIQTQPGRYQKIDGVWCSKPAEEYANRFGLSYTLVSDAQFNHIQLQNFDYLNSYNAVRDQLTFDPDILERVLRMISAYPGISLKDLKDELEISPDVINGMIAKDLIWVDLTAALLIQPDRVRVYSSQSSAETHAKYQPLPEAAKPELSELVLEGMRIQWLDDTYTIFKVHGNDVLLEDLKGGKEKIELHKFHRWAKDGDIRLLSMPRFKPGGTDEAFRDYSAEDWELAANHCAIVEEYLATGLIPKVFEKDPKTLTRWAARYEMSKQVYGDPIYGLLPQNHLKGCHKVRIDNPRLEVLVKLVKEHYLVNECPNIASAYAAIVQSAKRAGVQPPTRKLFRMMREDIGRYEEELARAGKRAAQTQKGPSPTDPNRIPAEGQWFLHRVHIDHVLLPIKIRDPETQKSLGCPWLTLLTDSATRSGVGAYLTFAKPSRKSVFMALRDSVIRFGQFPEYLISDNGREFRSYDYKCLAARYRFKLQWRPPSEAKFGANVERSGETIQQMFVNNLIGRTFPVQEDRLRTGKLKPDSKALWTLPEFKVELERFLYEDYDQMQHTGILMSPREARELSWLNHGKKAHRNVNINDEFLFWTTPTINTKRGYAKVQPGRGIKACRAWYNCEQFRTPGVPGTKVMVRMDPSNLDRCYACVQGKFVPLKRHITNSAYKQQYQSGSFEVYAARQRETERANDGVNLTIRGEMMERVEKKEAELLDQKNNGLAQKKQESGKKPVILKLVAKGKVIS